MVDAPAHLRDGFFPFCQHGARTRSSVWYSAVAGGAVRSCAHPRTDGCRAGWLGNFRTVRFYTTASGKLACDPGHWLSNGMMPAVHNFKISKNMISAAPRFLSISEALPPLRDTITMMLLSWLERVVESSRAQAQTRSRRQTEVCRTKANEKCPMTNEKSSHSAVDDSPRNRGFRSQHRAARRTQNQVVREPGERDCRVAVNL